jgi:hypothetical protein
MLFELTVENRDTSPTESNSEAHGQGEVQVGDAVRASLKKHQNVDAITTRPKPNGSNQTLCQTNQTLNAKA